MSTRRKGWDELTLAEFKEQVCDRSKEIDESAEQDWFSLSLGWALAKGLSPDDAHDFALHVRYDLHYWNSLG